MDELTLHVTQEDIDKAGEGCANCPIAQALVRTFPQNQPDYPNAAWVGAETAIKFWHEGQRVTFPHTYESLDFVSRYDDGGAKAIGPCTLVFKAGPLHV